MAEKEMCKELQVFGGNLNFIRSQEGLTVKQFAEKIGYDRVYSGRLLSGKQNIKLSTAIRIARNTGYSLSALFNSCFIDDFEYREGRGFEEINYLKSYLKLANQKMSSGRISQNEIAMTTDRDKAEISRILSGKINDPTIRTLSVISKAMNSSLSDMLRKEDI